jgi:biotin synthase-related radical SAM superfamily protein
MKKSNLGSVKHHLLAAGSAKVLGISPPASPASHAGPSLGMGGSVFFSDGISRVRLTLDESSSVLIQNAGSTAVLTFDTPTGPISVEGFVETVGCHCPRQAYITINEGCNFSCRYCNVPTLDRHIKTPDEIESLISDAVKRDQIECISLTSGVIGTVLEEEERLFAILERVWRFGLPVGVSVYPTPGLAKKLYDRGVAEVKFNLETTGDELFAEMCPGLDRRSIFESLKEAVCVFGKNRVYSNIILGLGESKAEMKSCIIQCLENGIIPIIRPLTPSAELTHFWRPSADEIYCTSAFLRSELLRFGLDPSKSLTMCEKCAGCDLAPMTDFREETRANER